MTKHCVASSPDTLSARWLSQMAGSGLGTTNNSGCSLNSVGTRCRGRVFLCALLSNTDGPIFMCGRFGRTRDTSFAARRVAPERCLVRFGHDPSTCANLVHMRGARLALGC